MKIQNSELTSHLSGKTFKDENFPVASFLVSKKNRKYIKDLYFFARASDDIADNKNLNSEIKLKFLKEFDKMIVDTNKKQYEFTYNLNKTLKNTGISKDYPRKLLIAFIQDVNKKRYKNWSELINYCDHSASPIGRFVVDLHLKKNNRIYNAIYDGCDNLCNALQILNHIQDCKEDYLNLNRIYIPEDFFKDEKLFPDDFLQEENRTKFLKIKDRCLDEVDNLSIDAKEKISLIEDSNLKKETFVIFNIAVKLCKILKKGDPLKKKLKLSRIDLIFCFFKGIIGKL